VANASVVVHGVQAAFDSGIVFQFNLPSVSADPSVNWPMSLSSAKPIQPVGPGRVPQAGASQASPRPAWLRGYRTVFPAATEHLTVLDQFTQTPTSPVRTCGRAEQ
jgi:hypothetical protein